MANYNSKSVEQKVLALLLQAPTHIRVLTLDVDTLFSIDEHKVLAKLIKEFVRIQKSAPTLDTLKHYVQTKLNSSNVELTLNSLLLIESLPEVVPAEAEYYFNQLENYRTGRALFDLHESMANNFNAQSEIDFINMKQEVLKSILTMGKDNPNIVRGFAYDAKFIKERIENYENAESGTNTDLIKFGIKGLDDLVGGMKKGTVSLAFSKTGGGKTIFALNVAYNAAAMGHNVMYISAEMSHSEISTRLDSRLTFLNSHNIAFGKLSPEDKKNYRNKIAEHYKNVSSGKRNNIYICDVARGASIPIILSELELYKSTRGIYPDLVVADYANIIQPTVYSPEMHVSLGRVMQEFKENAKYYKCAVLTMMQESRSSTIEQAKAEKKDKKDEVTDGVHNIAGSGFAAHHCDNTFHLKQSDSDYALGKIWLVINKSRGGVANNKKLALRCSFAKTYIGEDIVAL